MRLFSPKSICLVLIAASPLLLTPLSSALAQDGSMKACGEKWQAAKAANATNGSTWSKFLAECRTGLAAAATTTAAAPPVAKPVSEKPAVAKPVAEKAPAAPKDGTPVFPAVVSAKFAELGAGRARQKTCSEQYQANKASNGNGGLRWLEKGGGYWSLCNKKLKGA
jgi:hypothetical protein